MSGGATSNAGAVKAMLEALVKSVNFTSHGKGQSLGRDCLAAVAVGIRERTVDRQERPDGSPLAANRGEYAGRKEARGLPVGVGLRSKGRGDGGRMLSLQQVQGRQAIEAETATMTFGTDDAAMRKASWFTGGSEGAGGREPSGAKNQPPRPFYAMDDTLRREVMTICHEFVRDLIRRHRGP